MTVGPIADMAIIVLYGYYIISLHKPVTEKRWPPIIA